MSREAGDALDQVTPPPGGDSPPEFGAQQADDFGSTFDQSQLSAEEAASSKLVQEVSGTVLDRIGAVCSKLRQRSRDSSSPRIEDLIQLVPEDAQARGLSELIATEVELKRSAGEHVAIDGYLDRFSGREAIVREAFAIADRAAVPSHAPTAQPNASPAVSRQVGAADNEARHGRDDRPPLRFRLERELGRGSFGVVYLATDSILPRRVALKFPRSNRFESDQDRRAFLVDAQHAARLKHPGIVTIYDVRTDDRQLCIVQEYMPGGDLKQRLRSGPVTCEQAVAWMISIAEAMAFAHQHDVVHRDLKPSNILMDERGQARVSDFGLALHAEEQLFHRNEFAGTAAYMSPEQIRREAHRLDGRSDTWSLGVILYEMLTCRRPFRGAGEELFDEIKYREPRPLRELQPDLSAELERICLKCLEKPVAERYSAASDLAQDLRSWQQSQHRDPSISARETATRVVPKGLRAFDARDAEFFLSLLPGPRDRDGLPECIRFWKARIEETDPAATFAVGVLHGPSGCGKSSLIRAGLLPRLAPHVTPVLLDATPNDTESRLLKALRRNWPQIPQDLPLPEVLAGLRSAHWNPDGKKLLIVLDQFEQWLHAGHQLGPSALVDALRHCDGEHVQCLLLVREDFWTGISRFMQRLEIPLQEQRNSTLVDRFDRSHARRVLAEFGRAYGRLPENLDQMSEPQAEFLDSAIEELSEEGRVICVRLSLFGDLIKSKPWTLDVLEEAGGANGLGVTFLDDTFTGKSAPEAYRRQEAAVRKLFRALLPEPDRDIKGNLQSRDALIEACGYTGKPAAFDELIKILDEQLRLVTPVDVDDEATSAAPSAAPSQCYQITHDYLIPSLRTWLTRKQAERMRGRAELRLAEIASEWRARPANKRLPTTLEFASIELLTSRDTWSDNQRAVMAAATRYHVRRSGLVIAGMALVIAAIWGVAADSQNRLRSEQAENRRRQAELVTEAALTAPADAVPYAARNVEPLQAEALALLQREFSDTQAEPARRLRAAVLLTQFGQPQPEHLIGSIGTAAADECPNILAALKLCGKSALERLQQQFQQADSDQNRELQARLALTLYQLGDAAPAREMLRLKTDPTTRVTLIETLPHWHGSLFGLLRGLETEPEASRSGICLGIGAIPVEKIPADELVTAVELFERWYREMPEAGTHSATGWALRQWHRPEPQLPTTAGAEDRDWRANSLGMTMVRVPPSGGGHAGSGDAFWLYDREVSRQLYQAFIDDPNCPDIHKPVDWIGAAPDRSPTPEHPVQQVSWFDVVQFCNWLSRREGRTESYIRDGDSWLLVSGAGGYRLPTEVEWEQACRAGTTTEFVSGSNEQFLSRYAVYLSNQTGICGSKLPNPWGLFDMHGNVYEWCEDWDDTGASHVVRSGAFDYAADKARSNNRQGAESERQSYTIGLRVARDLD